MIIIETIKVIKTTNIFTSDIYSDILQSISKRKKFVFENGELFLPCFFCRIIGIEHNNQDEYLNFLYNFNKKMIAGNFAYNKIDFKLDTQVSNEKINRFNTIWSEIKGDSNLRATYIARNLYGAGVIKKTMTDSLDVLLKGAFEDALELFISSNIKNKNAGIIKNFCIKIIHWFEKYGWEDYKNSDFLSNNPKTLFFGDISRDEVFFMYFLSKLGFDVVFLNPFSDNHFLDAKVNINECTKLEYGLKAKITNFPIAEKMVQLQTPAFQAEQNVQTLMDGEITDYTRAWQFENYMVKSVSIKTTYAELIPILNAHAKSRVGFNVIDNTVHIPNIFAKINGSNTELVEYWADVLKILKSDMTILIDKMPFTDRLTHKKSFDYGILLNNKGLLDISKIKKCKDYKIFYLKHSLQNLLLTKANELIEKNHFNVDMDVDFRIKVISTLLNMDKAILDLLQRFDYPFLIPRIIIFHHNNDVFCVEDYITLAILNALCVDIVVITPTGYSNIENYINHKLFDVHNLTQIRFDLKLPKDLKKEAVLIGKSKSGGFFERIWGGD